ncbi:MAG: hypothetical protein ACRENA_12850 [Vulcanimicrobiaceae bacterium]
MAAAVALPWFVDAAPPQTPAAGVILPAGTIETIVLDESVDSSTSQPGSTIAAHLHGAIVLREKVLARAGAPVQLLVTATRRAGAGASGEIFLRVRPVELAGGIALPVELLHPAMTPVLVAANPQDVTLPHSKEQLKSGTDLRLPPGTLLRARTSATLDASNPSQTKLTTPPPYTFSTDQPYAAFTPIPLFTMNPKYTQPPRRRRGKAAASSSPSPSPSASPSASPSSTPT